MPNEELFIQIFGLIFYIMLIIAFLRVYRISSQYSFRNHIQQKAEKQGWCEIKIEWAPLAKTPFPYALWVRRKWLSYYVHYRNIDDAEKTAICHIYAIWGPKFYPIN